MNKIATLLLCVCFITVLFPQPGYIHPDEFFQSSEIVAGDVLQVIHSRAWEFNSSFPIRSIVFPYLLTAPPLHLLRWLNSTSFSGFRISAVKVVMATRLPVAFLNVFGYLATGKLASHFGVEKSLSTVLWCSSYVFWSYYTRTFSNSVESFLLASVLLLTMTSVPVTSVSKELGRESSKKKKGKSDVSQTAKEDTGEERSDSSATQDEPASKSVVSSQNYGLVSGNSSCFVLKIKPVLLGVLISAGFFNRPTFLLFSFIPVLYWYFSMSRDCRHFVDRITQLVSIGSYLFTGILLTFSVFIFVDSLYYNEDVLYVFLRLFHKFAANPFSFENISKSYEILCSSVVVTPWNFLKYNTDSNNLAQHGLHPRYTHFLVNLPLLLGPLYIPFVTVCISSIFLSLKRGAIGRSIWLVLMSLVPVVGLSIFPHQEPRFLIPMLPVLIVTGAKIVSVMAQGRRAFLIMWVIFNISLHLVYGYLHQAAIVPALSIYQQRLSSAPISRTPQLTRHMDHLIFYKTYPPPRHLLLLSESRSDVKIHDLAGAPFKDLMKEVSRLKREMQKPKIKMHIYIFLPSTVSLRFLDLLPESESDVSSSSICPHLSTESLPRFKDFFLRKTITFEDFLSDFCLYIVHVSAKE